MKSHLFSSLKGTAKLLLAASIATLFSWQTLANNEAESAVDLVIKNTTVLSAKDKHHTDIKTNHWVAIDNGRILEISNGNIIPKAKQVVDGTGKYLMPGLMDSHTHLTKMPGINRHDKNAAKMQKAFLERQGRNYLYYGVTQIVDAANGPDFIDWFNQDEYSPKAFFCGGMNIYQGYGVIGIPYHKLHERRPYYIALPSDPDASDAIKAAHQIDAVVRRIANDGATCAKLFIEDGFDTQKHWPILSTENFLKISQLAKAANLPVMAHANATDMYEIAIDAKVSILAHGLWNWLEERKMSTTEQFPPNVQAVLDKVIANDIAYQPTFNVIRSLKELMMKESLNDPEYQTILPKWQLDWYKSEKGQWFAKEMQKDWGNASIDFIVNRFAQKEVIGQRVLNYLYKNGATILLATDTPPATTFASQPGIATYKELKTMHQAGVDLSGLFAAATLNNAKAYNVDDDYGTVSKGKVANLLLLDSNPLTTVDAYNDIHSVILNGKAIERAMLHIDRLDNN